MEIHIDQYYDHVLYITWIILSLQVDFIGMSYDQTHIIRPFCLHWPEHNLLTHLSTEKQHSLLSGVGYNQSTLISCVYMHTPEDNINYTSLHRK